MCSDAYETPVKMGAKVGGRRFCENKTNKNLNAKVKVLYIKNKTRMM